MIERKSSLLLQLRRATRPVRRANTARRELESIPPTPRAATKKQTLLVTNRVWFRSVITR